MPMNSHHCRRAGISRSIFVHFLTGSAHGTCACSRGINGCECQQKSQTVLSVFLSVPSFHAETAGVRGKVPAGLPFRESGMRHERKYMTIGKRLIRTLPEFADIADSDVRIAYLSSDEEKRKNRRIVFGECHRVSKQYAWCCRYDFFIVVYEPNIDYFTDTQIELLIRHELHHVGIEYTDRGIRYYVVPHDVEEFWEIIDEHGIEWSDRYAEGTEPEQQEKPKEGIQRKRRV